MNHLLLTILLSLTLNYNVIDTNENISITKIEYEAPESSSITEQVEEDETQIEVEYCHDDLYVKVIPETLQVHENYFMDTEIVGRLLEGNVMKVEYMKSENGGNVWYKVNYTGREYGWIPASYCEVVYANEYIEYMTSVAISNDSTEIIESFITYNNMEVRLFLGEEDEALWDSIEMERLYYVYDNIGIAVVFENNPEYEVASEDSTEYIEFVEITEAGQFNGVNHYMTIDEVEGLLGKTEYIDYEYWYHDSGYPTRWIKLKYEYEDYWMNVYFNYDTRSLREIKVVPKHTRNLVIEEDMVNKLLEMDKESILQNYAYEELDHDWLYRHEHFGESTDIRPDQWVQLLDRDIAVGFVDTEIYALKIIGDYSIDGIVSGESMSLVSSKLGNPELQEVINDGEWEENEIIYYINDETEFYRKKYISTPYPNEDVLELFIYKK